MRFELDPSAFKVACIAVIVFIYSLTTNSVIITILQSRMPYSNEWIVAIFVALGADCMYLMAFLGISPPESEQP